LNPTHIHAITIYGSIAPRLQLIGGLSPNQETLRPAKDASLESSGTSRTPSRVRPAKTGREFLLDAVEDAELLAAVKNLTKNHHRAVNAADVANFATGILLRTRKEVLQENLRFTVICSLLFVNVPTLEHALSIDFSVKNDLQSRMKPIFSFPRFAREK
jgi:hypothetical protein